mgnify:CR=1 FL=1
MNALGKIVLIGVGLIGGSLMLDLKRRRQAGTVVGIDINADNLARALERHVIDEAHTEITADNIAQADLVVLATPVATLPSLCKLLSPHLPPHTVVSDVGSTKQSALAAFAQYLPQHFPRCVAAHPIAGSDRSGALAAHTSGINVIIDGHSHEQYTRVDKNKVGEDVLIEQTGTKLSTVGKVVIHDDGSVSGELVKGLTALDPTVKQVADEELAKADEQLAKPVGTATVDLVTDIDGVLRVRRGETNIGDFVTDALRASTNADVAIVNGGSFRTPILTGTITYNTLLSTFPFTNTLVKRSVMGQQLLDALELGAAKYPEDSGGFLHVSGLTYTIDARVPSSVERDGQGGFVRVAGEYRVRDVMVNGEPLDLTQDYTVVGTSYIMRNSGNGMTMFDGTPILLDSALSDVETIAAYIEAQGGSIGAGYENPEGQGRITIIE